jgi:integrase/recombinase XerD
MTYFGSRAPKEGEVFDRRGRRKYLDSSERKALLRAIKSERDPLRRAFVLTLLYTGCRISEALNVTKERLDETIGSITFETLKRRRAGCFRTLPIPKELLRLLRRIVNKSDPASRIWPFSRPTGYRLVTEWMSRSHIAGPMASPKGLRHSFAVACLAEKIPLPIVQKWLGHARMETTAIYLEVSGAEERTLALRVWEATKKRSKSSCRTDADR